MIDAALGADFADVDQAFDALGDLNEGSEVHELSNGTGGLRAHGKFLWDFAPWVAESLFEAEGNAALFGFDGKDDGVNAFALLEDVAGDADLLAPRHF